MASTPLVKGSIIPASLDPMTNPELGQALKVYAKHYLAEQEGIPGEGEDIATILSRLQGNDDNVKRMTVLGLKDKNSGKIVGVSFVETYQIDKIEVNGKQENGGLAHLCTYAAVEPPHEKTSTNVAFHAAILDKITHIDKELGCKAGHSILTSEVNSVLGFKGEKLSDAMNPEFEIKTGAPREMREAYTLGGGENIIPLQGKHNTAYALGLNYAPPNLGEGDDRIKEKGLTATDLAPLLSNHHIANGEGEPLFATIENPHHIGVTARDAAMHKAFLQQLNVSVAQGNHGIEDKNLIVAALENPLNKGYGDMMEGHEKLAKSLTPSNLIPICNQYIDTIY